MLRALRISLWTASLLASAASAFDWRSWAREFRRAWLREMAVSRAMGSRSWVILVSASSVSATSSAMAWSSCSFSLRYCSSALRALLARDVALLTASLRHSSACSSWSRRLRSSCFAPFICPVTVSLSWAIAGRTEPLMSTPPSMADCSSSLAADLSMLTVNLCPPEFLAVSGIICSSVALALKTAAAASSSSTILLSSHSASQRSLLCCCLAARARSRPSSTRARSPCMRLTSSADRSWAPTADLSDATRDWMEARVCSLPSSSAERAETFFSRAALCSFSWVMSWWNLSRSDARSACLFSRSGREFDVCASSSMVPTISSFSTAMRSASCSTVTLADSNLSMRSSSRAWYLSSSPERKAVYASARYAKKALSETVARESGSTASSSSSWGAEASWSYVRSSMSHVMAARRPGQVWGDPTA
mmetsp:Transcript_12608/g.25052  ORF Transcript_12608/g.25052 Transcript_12608/m.25052 type:complete len:422 (-) Transcript_12608:517-1782(-)